MLLSPCAATFYEDLEAGQSTTLDEIERGWLQSPVMGPSLTPCKASPRAIARCFKEGKIKDRCIANLSCPQQEHLHQHSVNASFAMDDPWYYPTIKFISPVSVAHAVATLIPICGAKFVLAKNDWAKWSAFALTPRVHTHKGFNFTHETNGALLGAGTVSSLPGRQIQGSLAFSQI